MRDDMEDGMRDGMKPRLSGRSLASTVLPFALLIVLVIVVWPARFGGSAVFVVVRGESMEPHYHSGDLLYARTGDDFVVGDIAVYERPNTATGATSLVVHRIVESFEDGTFQFKGDNRDSVDLYRPSLDDIVARPMANLGPVPAQFLVRLPLLLAIAVAITVIWALWPRRDETDVEGDDLTVDPVPSAIVQGELAVRPSLSLREFGLDTPSWTPLPRHSAPAPTHRSHSADATVGEGSTHS